MIAPLTISAMVCGASGTTHTPMSTLAHLISFAPLSTVAPKYTLESALSW